MKLILRHSPPEDWVAATCESRTVREWCERAFARVGLDYRDHVVVDPAFSRPTEPVPLVGDSGKARRLLGWSPSLSFPDLVDLMMDAELAAKERAAGRST